MPLFFLSKEENVSVLAIWQITEAEQDLVKSLPEGAGLLEEANALFLSATRRLEWLAVRRLLYELGIHQKISYHSSGRPYFADGLWNISISHTRGYAAVLLHRDSDVGVDIEQKSQRVFRVRSRFLSLTEEQTVVSVNADREQDILLLLWSAKETMFKIIDREAVDFSEDFSILPFRLKEEGLFKAAYTGAFPSYMFNIRYRIFHDFVCTCSIAVAAE